MSNQQELINKIKSYNKHLNPEILNKAYDFAVNAHKHQKRKSGDPYYIHPVAVADILTDLKLDSATIVTGLLHDTIEDTETTYGIVLNEFGKEVADLVDGVTKISALEEKTITNSKAENFRKLILATSKDIRVLLVKLADRLHNMRTIHGFESEEKKSRIAKETMEIYAPLADRMGMNRIRDELEDLSFSVLNPDARNLIVERLKSIKGTTDELFDSISKTFGNLLKEKKIKSDIVGRKKTPFSIWRKLQTKRVSLEQLTDIVGFRIIVKDLDDCYKTLGLIHSNFSTIPGRFKDYISTPKINGYKSIHTSVIGPLRERIEIQIRTGEMHDFAQRGIVSHWNYKTSEKLKSYTVKEYSWLKDLVDIINTKEGIEDNYEFTKLQMFQDNVFCFTPKGTIIKLPKNATPIDFAYAVHTTIGHTAIGCQINGRTSPLQSELKNGDMVEIMTSKNISPSLHWLSSSKTGKARASIRKYWGDKLAQSDNKNQKTKEYSSTIIIDLPNKPGMLGEVSTLFGMNNINILNVELTERKNNHLQFLFDLKISNLKNYTSLISQIKEKNLNFRIIRHKRKKNAFIERIFKNFKKI